MMVDSDSDNFSTDFDNPAFFFFIPGLQSKEWLSSW